MNAQEAYEILYENMSNGVYNGVVRGFENNLKPTSEIIVSKVKEACKKKNVNFDDFLKYAQKRKREENVSTRSD